MAGGGDTMFIAGIHPGATESELAGIAGALPGFRCMRWKGGEKPMCWVAFHDPQSCAAAVALLQGKALDSCQHQVLIADFAKQPLQKGDVPPAAAMAMASAQQQQWAAPAAGGGVRPPPCADPNAAAGGGWGRGGALPPPPPAGGE
eukprot:gene4863-50833_t